MSSTSRGFVKVFHKSFERSSVGFRGKKRCNEGDIGKNKCRRQKYIYVYVPVLCKHHRSFHPPRQDCRYSIIRAWPGTVEGQGYWPTVAVPSYPEQFG